MNAIAVAIGLVSMSSRVVRYISVISATVIRIPIASNSG